jgi:hypothetical protein
MEPEVSLPHSQETATKSQAKSVLSSPDFYILFI